MLPVDVHLALPILALPLTVSLFLVDPTSQAHPKPYGYVLQSYQVDCHQKVSYQMAICPSQSMLSPEFWDSPPLPGLPELPMSAMIDSERGTLTDLEVWVVLPVVLTDWVSWDLFAHSLEEM